MLKLKRTKPEKILLADDVYVLWRDGHESHYAFLDLRDACPCAECVDEITGQKRLERSSIPPDIHPLGSEYVGNYALRIHWSDGHSTGLYNFKTLRGMDETADDTSEKGSA